MAETLTKLETLAQSITEEVKEEVPHLERPHVRLQGLVEQIRKQLTKRDLYQARKQEATRKAHADIRQAKATANLVRKTLTEHYGSDNEQLERFAIKPFRGRKRKKPKGSP
jgi:hypothetical protein